MEPAVPSPAAPPLPVAWLQGDVLAEYLRFLELEGEAAPAPRVPVAWLQGEARDEFLRFLEESAAVACPDPERQEDKEHASAPHGSDDVDDVDGDEEDEGGFVDDDYGDADACVTSMEYRSEDGGVVFTMDTDEDDDPVLQLLLPHILDLPAFRARAAGQRQQQPPLATSPREGGGWMSSRQDGWMRSELELLRSRIQDLQARVGAAGVVQQHPHLAVAPFPRQDGLMSSDDDDEMTDEFPRQDDDDGWMGSDKKEEMTDEFTGNRNRLQLRHTR